MGVHVARRRGSKGVHVARRRGFKGVHVARRRGSPRGERAYHPCAVQQVVHLQITDDIIQVVRPLNHVT